VDITSDRVSAYIEARQAEGAAQATIQQELAHLKRAFNMAVRGKLLTTRPYIEGVPVHNARTGFVEPDELERVLAELSPDLRPLVQFCALTGWRVGEVRPLTWSQVDFKAGEVRLWTSKNDEPRVFPFHNYPALRELLEAQRERTRELERKTGCIVPTVFHRGGRPIQTFGAAWRGACKRAGVAGRLVHDLRRTAVRALERAGVPRSTAMALTGHKTASVYARYAIQDAKSHAEGVEKLARLQESPTETAPVVPKRPHGGCGDFVLALKGTI